MTTRLQDQTPLGAVRRDQFPPDFRWGCATSSYQIEGAVDVEGRCESIWDRFCASPGRIRQGHTGARACDHYHRWPEDLDIAQAMGLNAYRFSIAWPRIAPGRGQAMNRAGLDFYSRLVDGMLERGLEPWATLFHWDLPQWLQDEGGWVNRSTVEAFLDYTDAVTRVLGDRVRHWITHNEPWCTAFLGHQHGVHAPGLRDLPASLQVCHHLLLSHGLAIPVIRSCVPAARAGITLSLHPLRPATSDPRDAAAVDRHDGLRNRWFLDPLHGRGYPADTWSLLGKAVPKMAHDDLAHIAAATDFLGVNYYFPETVADAPGEGPTATRTVEPHGVERTAFGWEVAPQGMVDLLARVHAQWAPGDIVLTENGSTYDDVMLPDGRVEDAARRDYLARHLAAARIAIEQGIPLKGYFAWSLLDNFEWAEGYTRRFGLVHVDFATQARTLKSSGRWYAQFLAG